ncbi:hypothetical protein MGN70_006562 [Eutypa lata]|nr:hypothetical protein MGN70_006562 [Eutypa lata]
MANYRNSVHESSSPVDSSQSGLLGEHTIRRSVIRIANDQKKLLDKKEAWAHEACNRQQWFNVPPEVLQNLKALHSRKLKARSSKVSSSLKGQQINAGPNDRGKDLSGSIPTTPQKGRANVRDNDHEGQDDKDDDDADETRSSSSWEESPEHHRHPPGATRFHEVDQEEVEREEILTQLPPDSSLPQPSASPSPKKTTFNDAPSSSLGPENDLELEIPAALDISAAPINKTAQQVAQPMLATPPSAQIVPCTYEDQDSPPTKDKIRQSKTRPVYKKVPELYRPPQTVRTTSSGSGLTRLWPSKPALVDSQCSTSTTDMSSSSIIPATHCEIPMAMDVDDPLPESSHNLAETSSIPERQKVSQVEEQVGVNTSSLETPQSTELRQASPEYIPPSPKIKYIPPPPTATTSASLLSQPIDKPESPFIEYTLKYPSYTGSLGDFVTACVYLQTLAGRRRLRPFLFDDFIRAWSEGYLPYVRECDESEPRTKALTALEWFNQIDDPPTYTKQVITAPVLERIVGFYPEEALSARGILRVSQKTTPEKTASKGKLTATGTLSLPGTGSQSSLKSSAPSIDRASQGGTSTVADILGEKAPEPSVPATSAVVHRAPSPPVIPPNRSTSELQKRTVPTTGLSRSLSEAAPTSHKRKPSNDDGFQVPAPKKVLSTSMVSSRPTSSSGASIRSDGSKATAVSAVPSSSIAGSSGRRRFADDPEKRRRKFAKFVKKNYRDQRRDSIVTSSAPPVGNNKTPTSGQRQEGR